MERVRKGSEDRWRESTVNEDRWIEEKQVSTEQARSEGHQKK